MAKRDEERMTEFAAVAADSDSHVRRSQMDSRTDSESSSTVTPKSKSRRDRHKERSKVSAKVSMFLCPDV